MEIGAVGVVESGEPVVHEDVVLYASPRLLAALGDGVVQGTFGAWFLRVGERYVPVVIERAWNDLFDDFDEPCPQGEFRFRG